MRELAPCLKARFFCGTSGTDASARYHPVNRHPVRTPPPERSPPQKNIISSVRVEVPLSRFSFPFSLIGNKKKHNGLRSHAPRQRALPRGLYQPDGADPGQGRGAAGGHGHGGRGGQRARPPEPRRSPDAPSRRRGHRQGAAGLVGQSVPGHGLWGDYRYVSPLLCFSEVLLSVAVRWTGG